MRWSIRTKILIILSALLLLVVSAHLILAEKILREDKELLVYETNRSNAEQLANEVDGSIRRVIDKMELLAELVLNKPTSSASLERSGLAENFFEKDPDLLAFQLIASKPDRGKPVILGELISKKKLHSANIPTDHVKSFETLPSSFESGQGIVVENRSNENAILFLIRVPVTIRGKSQTSQVYAQAWVDGRSWQDPFEDSQSLALNFAVTSNGEVFAHPHLKWVLSRKNLGELEILKEARSHNFILQQMEFDFENTRYLGVYRKTALGNLTIISMMDKGTARLASRLLLEKTIILSLIIVTAVLLISLYFSGSLSTPLLRLVNATRQIAQGNFDTPIEVQTRDEIGILASAFSQMAKELKSSRLLLEEYNRGLERKVQERTQELEDKNAAIREQQEEMLKSTRLAAVGEIAGHAAHEVLNPLTAMISILEDSISRIQQFTQMPSAPLPVFRAILSSWDRTFRESSNPQSNHKIEAWLKDMRKTSEVFPGKTLAEEDTENLGSILRELELVTSKLKNDLGIILRESHRVGRIVDQMRGLSRHSRIPSTVEVHSLITECIHVTEDLLSRFKIKIETQFESSPLYISADSDEMRQVLSNLIKNAMDGIHELRKSEQPNNLNPLDGLIRITTQISADLIKITVWDNGIGIPEENQDRIFEANFSTKGLEGTGFGLGICRRFVHESGGEIILSKSKSGEFTEFELTFPRAQEKPQHGA